METAGRHPLQLLLAAAARPIATRRRANYSGLAGHSFVDRITIRGQTGVAVVITYTRHTHTTQAGYAVWLEEYEVDGAIFHNVEYAWQELLRVLTTSHDG